jgi:hypothetical protein
MLNRRIAATLGGLHPAECVLYSIDFAEIERMQTQARWDNASHRLAELATSLEAAGADVALRGIRFTMAQPFYRERLEQHGLPGAAPDETDRGSCTVAAPKSRSPSARPTVRSRSSPLPPSSRRCRGTRPGRETAARQRGRGVRWRRRSAR